MRSKVEASTLRRWIGARVPKVAAVQVSCATLTKGDLFRAGCMAPIIRPDWLNLAGANSNVR